MTQNMRQTDLSFDTKDVFSIFNPLEAKEYIGSEGYFAYTLSELQERVENNFTCLLEKIDEEIVAPYMNDYKKRFSLFLPANKVIKVEKKWRPFSPTEFEERFKIGQVVTFRSRGSDYHGKWLYEGYATGGTLSDRYVLYLGARFSLEELFNDYEYQDADGNWRRFGVEA